MSKVELRKPTNQMSLGERRATLRAPSAPKQKLCTCRLFSMVSVRLCRFLTPLTASGRSSAACAASVAVVVLVWCPGHPQPGNGMGSDSEIEGRLYLSM